MKPGWTSFLLTIATVALGYWVAETYPSVGGIIVGMAIGIEAGRRLHASRDES